MTFLELYTEFAARGFSHLSVARQKSYINRARSRLDGLYTWPYREDSIEGVAPLAIAALGIVEAVSNETRGYALEEAGYRDLVDWGCDLSQTGSPEYWYKVTPAGVPGIATWPTSSDTIGVQYWAVTADMVATGDEPDLPARFHPLIVDMAQQAAERERANHQVAQALQEEIDRQVNEMVNDLLPQQSPRFVRVTGASEDW